MPKKSRKGRMKYKSRRGHKPSGVREAKQAQPTPVLPRQASIIKPQIMFTQPAEKYRQITKELKRICLIAIILFILLFILIFLLR